MNTSFEREKKYFRPHHRKLNQSSFHSPHLISIFHSARDYVIPLSASFPLKTSSLISQINEKKKKKILKTVDGPNQFPLSCHPSAKLTTSVAVIKAIEHFDVRITYGCSALSPSHARARRDIS